MIDLSGNKVFYTIWRDVTERKLAGDALRESEETYRSILNASPDDITITDLDGRLLMVSPAAHTMFGYERGYAFQNLQISDFLVPEDLERALSSIRLMYQEGYSGPNEYRGVRKDRSIFDMEVNSGLIRGADGQPNKMVFIVRDITERKQTERDRDKLIADLQKALAEIRTLQGILSICSSCKKIRDDKGSWKQMEAYISEHSAAEFSHGYCPECGKKALEEFERFTKERMAGGISRE